MTTLYIECKMGAAGDMLMAAMYELLAEEKKTEFINKMNAMFGPDITLCIQPRKMAGISGTYMHVSLRGQQEAEHVHSHGQEETAAHAHSCEHGEAGHVHSHSHYSYTSVLSQIEHLPLAPDVRAAAAAVYRLIGEAEAKVHGTDLTQIHFHEVGSMDALADVTGTCLLISMLAPARIVVSPVHVGNGMVHCAHGILPVPAPATAEILKGIPFYTGGIDTELCTPTGAALLRHFATEFAAMPAMTLQKTGIGFGSKELPMLNAVRVFLGETSDAAGTDQILDISCNLDDMTGEALGYAMEVLLAAGALDVFYIPIQMKKNRPGVLLHCFCGPSEREIFTALMLRHTTTRGVRCQLFDRSMLSSHFETVDSIYGSVTRKVSEGFGLHKAKYEYEDLKRIAGEQNLSLAELMDKLI